MRFHDSDALPVVICKFTHVLILRQFKYYPAVEYKKIYYYMQVVVEKLSSVTCKGTEVFTHGWSEQRLPFPDPSARNGYWFYLPEIKPF